MPENEGSTLDDALAAGAAPERHTLTERERRFRSTWGAELSRWRGALHSMAEADDNNAEVEREARDLFEAWRRRRSSRAASRARTVARWAPRTSSTAGSPPANEPSGTGRPGGRRGRAGRHADQSRSGNPGYRFKNTSEGPLPVSRGLPLTFRAEQPGAAFNVEPGTPLEMVASLPGVSPHLTAIKTEGLDEELRTRCRRHLATLAPQHACPVPPGSSGRSACPTA